MAFLLFYPPTLALVYKRAMEPSLTSSLLSPKVQCAYQSQERLLKYRFICTRSGMGISDKFPGDGGAALACVQFIPTCSDIWNSITIIYGCKRLKNPLGFADFSGKDIDIEWYWSIVFWVNELPILFMAILHFGSVLGFYYRKPQV